MKQSDQICAYLEAMAEKVGGDVRVFTRGDDKYFMHRKGHPGTICAVSMEDKREDFNDKVKWLMEVTG